MSRKQRLLALSGVAVTAVVAVALVAALSSSAKKTLPPPTASSFLAGVPQRGAVLGRAAAPATLIVFEDPQCPYCRAWSLEALPSVVADFVKTGRVKLQWDGIPVVSQNSMDGLRAAYSAGNENHLWNLVDQLYQRQGPEKSGWITVALLRDAATAAGTDPDKMFAAINSASVTQSIQEAEAVASQAGIRGTPTFVLVKPPAAARVLSVSGLDSGTFDVALAAALE